MNKAKLRLTKVFFELEIKGAFFWYILHEFQEYYKSKNVKLIIG